MFWYMVFSFLLTPALVDMSRNYAPDEFILNMQTHTVQRAWNMSYPRSVEKTGDEHFTMDSACTVVLSCTGINQYRFECTPFFHNEHAMRIVSRTCRADYTNNRMAGLQFDIDEHSLRIYEQGHLLSRVDSVHFDASQDERVVLSNYAGDYVLHIGCDKVYRGHTTLENSDAIVLQSGAHSTIRMQSVVRNSSFDDSH